MPRGAGFSPGQQGGSPGMAHGVEVKGWSRLTLERPELPSPGMFVCTGAVLVVLLFPKNCSRP